MRIVLLSLVIASAALFADRRVVDTVHAGDPVSESAHGYAGHEAVAGIRDGAPWRATAGWMHYTMTVFDDTPVTVALHFADDSVTRQFDLVVEDSVLVTRQVPARTPGAPMPEPGAVVEVAVPFAITKGKPNITIVLRARGGLTPALRDLRTLQDHNEQ